MKFEQRLKNTWRRGRVLRYRAYKKIGMARHWRKIDLSLFLMFMLCAATFPFFISRTSSQSDYWIGSEIN